MRTTVHRAGVLAVALSFALLGGAGAATATEPDDTTPSRSTTTTAPDDPSEEESAPQQPPVDDPAPEEPTATTDVPVDPEAPAPLVSVAADCADPEFGSYVTVDVSGVPGATYSVTVTPQGSDTALPAAEGVAGEDGFLRTEFYEIPAGDHGVTVTGADGAVANTQANVRPCDDIETVESELDVEVRCFEGTGLVIFTVSNLSEDPEAADRTFTLTLDQLPLYDLTDLPSGFLLTVTENNAPDGEYTAELIELEQVIDSETFVVDCVEDATPSEPAGQGSPGPADDEDLAYTGAAVGGLLGLGALALGLGGLLVFLGRRRGSAV